MQLKSQKEVSSGTGHWTQHVPVQRICHSIARGKLTDSGSNFGKTLPSLPPRCYCWAWCDGMENLFGPLGWAVPVVSPPKLLLTLSHSLVQQSCAGALQLWLKHWCAVNTGLVTKVKPTTLQIVLKKINSLPTTLSTARQQKCLCCVET